MKRRNFLKQAAAGAAAAVVASPAIAQSMPSVKWRCPTSWPKSLDALQGCVEDMSARVKELTDGKFEIQVFAAGEIVPATQIFDAVSAGTVECGHTLTAFAFGKNPAYAFDSGVAFGANSRQQSAWYFYGGGKELLRELFAKANIVNMPCGNNGVQMGGWYNKEIRTVDDLKGLKMRIGGLGGIILAKLGVVPQQLAPGDIYTSIEKGTIDAAEFIGPYDDEKLGLQKVTKFYYTPGWWEGSTTNTTLVNKAAYDALPASYKAALEVANTEVIVSMPARYDVKNPDALKRILASGVQLRAFPQPVMDACYKATVEAFNELSAKNADFKKVYDHWKTFMNDSNEWFKVAEFRLDATRFNLPRW